MIKLLCKLCSFLPHRLTTLCVTTTNNNLNLTFSIQKPHTLSLTGEMRDESPLPVSTTYSHAHAHASSVLKKETLDSSIFRYNKFWILSSIILLAFWSILSLHFSLTNLNRLSDDFSIPSPLYHDFDVLEIEEQEKVVKQMWDAYINSPRIKLPRFWQEAFVAAYEDLTSDATGVREAAISEIAKMSLHSSIDVHLPPRLHLSNLRELSLRRTQQNEAVLPLQ